MLKNISNLGSVLNRSEQQSINGGSSGCHFQFQCYTQDDYDFWGECCD